MLRPSFRAPPRFSTRTVPQPQAVVALATIKCSSAFDEKSGLAINPPGMTCVYRKSDSAISAVGCRSSHIGRWKLDCLAGHVGLELRNVDANYPFERSHRFAGIQPNSGFGDYSRLSCGGWREQLVVLAAYRAGSVGFAEHGLRPSRTETGSAARLEGFRPSHCRVWSSRFLSAARRSRWPSSDQPGCLGARKRAVFRSRNKRRDRNRAGTCAPWRSSP
jgi:hypothetical protein